MWWSALIPATLSLLRGESPVQAATNAAVSTATGNLLNNVIPGAQIPTSPANIIPGSIESELGAAGVDGVFRNADYFANVFGTPVYTGGQGLLSNLGDEAKAALSNLTPDNLTGLASLLQQQPDTSAYRQSAGTGGGVSRGQLGQSQPLSNVAVNRRKMNIWA